MKHLCLGIDKQKCPNCSQDQLQILHRELEGLTSQNPSKEL